MVNKNLELIKVFREDGCKYDKVEVTCKLCGQRWNMWRSHYYRGDTPCDCHHWGKKNKRLYSIYTNIKTRCYNSNVPGFTNYGGRGITMCDTWFNSFLKFKDWAISQGYRDDLTIERIDVNGNYEPDNCTWIKSPDQAKNKRTTIRVDGTSLRDWCIKRNLKYKIVHQYMKKHPELSLEEVLNIYINKYKELKYGTEPTEQPEQPTTEASV